MRKLTVKTAKITADDGTVLHDFSHFQAGEARTKLVEEALESLVEAGDGYRRKCVVEYADKSAGVFRT